MSEGLSVHEPFDEPFNQSVAATTDDAPHFLPVSIGSHAFMIDPREYRRVTVDIQREQYDAQAEPSESSFNTTGLWKRTQRSWQHGQGQEEFDVAEESDRRRFYTSKGVDVLNPDGKMRLLPDTNQRNLPADPKIRMRLLEVNDLVYLSINDRLWFTEDIDAGTIVWEEVTLASSNNIDSLATDGTNVYASVGSQGIYETAAGTTSSSQLTTHSCDHVWYASGRLLLADGNLLAEVSASGDVGPTGSIFSFENRSAGFGWSAVVGTPAGILAAGAANNRSEIYVVTVDTDGSLTVPRVATSLPAGEVVYALGVYTSVVLIGTSRGFRFADLSGDGVVYGPAVETSQPVETFAGYGEYLYFGWSSFDGFSSGLGKVDLSRQFGTLAFAHASDLMAGVSPGRTRDIVVRDGRRHFLVVPAEGETEPMGGWSEEQIGLFSEADELVAQGTLTSSWITFGTTELKIGRWVSVHHDPLQGLVTVRVQSEDGNQVGVGTSSIQASLGPRTPWRFEVERIERIRVIYILTRDANDATKGPAVRHSTLAAMPTPARIEQFLVPIILHTTVVNHQGDGTEVHFDTREEFEYLKELERSKRAVAYREGSKSYMVHIDGIEMQPHRWNDETSFFEGLCFVRMYTTQ